MQVLYRGWYQVAFERDLVAPLTAAQVGTQRLVLVRHQHAPIRAFDAVCPHRGAHLAYGGHLEHDAIVCGFHHYRICLGQREQGLSVREYATLIAGGMVFVRLGSDGDNGWPEYAQALERDCVIVNGFEMLVATSMETVIENAFDRRHFSAVHGIRTDPFTVGTGTAGELIVESTFFVPPPVASGLATSVAVRYQAIVPSPGLAVVELQGDQPYLVITGATDTGDGGCVIRLSLAFPKRSYPQGPRPAAVEGLLAHSRRGLKEDRVFWEHLTPLAHPAWTAEDDTSQRFLDFCRAHRDA